MLKTTQKIFFPAAFKMPGKKDAKKECAYEQEEEGPDEPYTLQEYDILPHTVKTAAVNLESEQSSGLLSPTIVYGRTTK